MIILAGSALAAILSRVHARIVLPTVVLELVLEILIGARACGSTSPSSA